MNMEASMKLENTYGATVVAWSDAWPLGMQTVAGSILMSGNILSSRLVMKLFLHNILSFPLIQERQLSVTGERMCT